MRRNLKIILTTTAMFALAGGMFGPIYAVFVEEIGGDLFTAGGAISLFGISTGVLMLFTGKLEDRVKRKERIFVLSYLINCIGYLGYLFISKPLHLFIVEAIFGVGVAINTPVYYTLYSKAVDKKKSTFQWGMTDATWYIVGGVAALMGGYFANLYGFRFIFVMMFIFFFNWIACVIVIVKKEMRKPTLHKYLN